jgi:nucleoside-diphosphate-sugar epimerase
VPTVVITGAEGALGTRVCALTASDRAVDDVVRLELDLLSADLKTLFEGAESVVHLADGIGSTGVESADVEVARRVLDAAAATGAGHVVIISSATVYGAWPNNPVPLTEDAALRPNPGVVLATQKAEIERLASEWRDDHPNVGVALLRPAVIVAKGANGWLSRALRGKGTIAAEDEPPAQFLDVDDLATAVDLARRQRLDGAFNVAPDGWVSGETVRALAGGAPRLHLPERLATRVAAIRFRWGLTSTPPELVPYTVHPWVIANDRLKAEGWEPQMTNEEAYVTAHEAGPWATLSPSRRQEIALAASGVGIAAVVGGAVSLIRRRRK